MKGKYIILLVLVFFMTVQSCGTFRKARSKFFQKEEINSELIDRSRETRKDSTLTIRREKAEFLFTFDRPVKSPLPLPGHPTDTVKDPDLDKLDRLIDRLISLSMKVEKEHIEQKAESEEKQKDIQQNDSSKSTLKTSDTDIDRDTTWASNVPWFVWLMAAGGVVALYLLKGRR